MLKPFLRLLWSCMLGMLLCPWGSAWAQADLRFAVLAYRAALDFGVAVHHAEVGADEWSEVDFVDDEQIAETDRGAAFAGDFVSLGDVDHVDEGVDELGRKCRGEIIAAALDEDEAAVEGTLTRWLKKVGDKIERDEPLFEISTDKVDAEIPAPAAGVRSGRQQAAE